MTNRKYNFSAGPALLPEAVLAEAKENLLSLGDTGVGVMEHSHRGPAFQKVYHETIANCRALANIPDEYSILFLAGGASTQFYSIPMNFLSEGVTADYINTGTWSKKAIAEAKRFGHVHVAATSEDNNFNYIPEEISYSDSPRYVHFTSNNTIVGTQFKTEPIVPVGTPLLCDASSDIFSRPIDITKYAMLYAGAQKNLGPSGLALIIIRNDFAQQASTNIPTMLQYVKQIEQGSMFNTPPTFGIYIMGLVFKWLQDQGGLSAMEERNQQKANQLYEVLDKSHLFQTTTDANSRSLMNITFKTGNDDLDKKFLEVAESAQMSGLKGHRSVGGMRASIYNAFPIEGVHRLIEVIQEFESKHG